MKKLLILTLFLGACSSIDIFKEKMEVRPIPLYQTFVIVNQEAKIAGFQDNFLDAIASSGLQNFLEEQGMVYDQTNPDVVIRYTSNQDPRQKDTYNYPIMPMWGMRVWDPWMFDPMWNNRMNPVTTKNYELFQFIVDFIDPKQEKLVIRITAVTETSNPKEQQKKLEKSVNLVGKAYLEHINNQPKR
ncbi:DUF4136 domain-containing protein [Mongoliitalea daihaiensis]|uniref:DUF4136 domain-containing protein n=1 Tax=Mongoliitalea daihaiensis TaxID=2782006 RepID=UPI001F379B42|nr:DUF4136 domain-containing protein [Mongoliitalea daihaiensis]UJP64369.1 DUF4136 domain-containing protein [Mongoliitalea daihaiensis]